MAEAQTYHTHRFEIPAFRVAHITSRMEALSNKAVSLGMPAFDIEVSAPVTRKIPGTRNQYAPYQSVSVTGGPPVIAGWQFVAKIEHDGIMNLVKGFGAQVAVDLNPGLFDQLSNCPPDCEHCNVKRDRNTTFVFAHSDDPGKTIQVGSTCVADFAGHPDPALLLSAATGWQDLIREVTDPEYLESTSPRQRMWEFEDLVAASAAVVRLDGHWISRDAADGLSVSTVDTVEYLLAKPAAYERTVRQQDKQLAAQARQWLSDDNFDHQGQVYLLNLRALALRNYVDVRNIGLAASATVAYKRAQAKLELREKERSSLNNVKLGTPGERLTLNVKVQKIIPIDTQYGMTRLHLMRDLASNARLTWFNSGNRKFFEGDEYQITGRVKDHTTRDGVWQTQLLRVNSPDIKLQASIEDAARIEDDDLLATELKKISKKVTTAVHKDARDGEGQTVFFSATRALLFNGDRFRDLVVQCMQDGHSLAISDDHFGLTPFDHLVMAEDAELVGEALTLAPELAECWPDERLDDYGITDADTLARLASSGDLSEHSADTGDTMRLA